jgi:hypothetical protein
MHSRCCALFSACILTVAVGVLSAETTSSEILLADHQDWTGHVNQSVIRDGSVLTEYIAQTTSVNMEGAVLLVFMIPRFSCVPVASILVNDAMIASRAADVDFIVVMDNQTIDFPFIPDRDGSDARFTLSSVGSDQKKIRSILDLASWATFNWSVDSDVPKLSGSSSGDSPVEASGNIDFSLLGSQKTVEAMEEMCRSHASIPLTN